MQNVLNFDVISQLNHLVIKTNDIKIVNRQTSCSTYLSIIFYKNVFFTQFSLRFLCIGSVRHALMEKNHLLIKSLKIVR